MSIKSLQSLSNMPRPFFMSFFLFRCACHFRQLLRLIINHFKLIILLACLLFCCNFRPVKGICGFSRETVIAVTTNIESIEFRRRESAAHGFEEHPRAGTTDDVEVFFALLHRFLSLVFTLKDFKALWRKLVR